MKESGRALVIQNQDECVIEENERVVLRNFLQALHRQFMKQKWTRVEKFDFLMRSIYLIGYDVILVFQMRKSNRDFQWMPDDQLIWNLLLYPSTIIVDTFFDYYLVEAIRNEYMPAYSREERALYQEQRSIISQPLRKLYVPLFIFSFVVPAGFSIAASFIDPSEGAINIVGSAAGNSFFILLPVLPLLLGISFLVTHIVGDLLLNYGGPLYRKIARMMNSNNTVLQAREALVEHLKMSLFQVIRDALRRYRMDPDRFEHYHDALNRISKIKEILDIRKEYYLHLELLIAIIKTNNSYRDSDLLRAKRFEIFPLLKRLSIIGTSLGYLSIFFLFQIGGSIDIDQDLFGLESWPHEHSKVLRVFATMADSLGYLNRAIVFTYLFKNTLSLLLNKSSHFLRSFLKREANISLIIQQHPYLFTFVLVMSLLPIVFSLPFITFIVFFDWVSGGFKHEFDFDKVQYTNKDALLSFYFPAIAVLSYVIYPAGRLMKTAFSYIMRYFSNEQQHQELQLEQYMKIVCQLIKACKPDSFLEILYGLSNQQLRDLFDREDFESLLEEVYRKNGKKTADDKVYNQKKGELLGERNEKNVEAQDEVTVFTDEIIENEDNTEEPSAHPAYSRYCLAPRETIKLIIKIREQEFEKRNQGQGGRLQILQEETEQLIPSKGRSWLSSDWCRSARCTLY